MDDQPWQVPAAVAAARRRAASAGFTMACDDRTGALLRTLAASKPGGRLLELGTGTGVGTAWLLAGASPDAEVVTVEADPAWSAVAAETIGHDPRVRVVVADAVSWLSGYRSGPFDLAFVDCLPGKFTDRGLVLRHLAPGALYIGDDLAPVAAWPDDHRQRVAGYLDEISAEPALVPTLLRWSSGLVVAAVRAT